MSNTTIVRNTAKESTFRGGPIWIQTLNSIHRTDAEREAHFAVAIKMQPLRKGQPVYKAYKIEFDAQSVEQRIKFLSGHEVIYGEVTNKASEKYLLDLAPEREEKDTDQSYTEKIAAYQKKFDTVIEQRKKFVETSLKKYEADLRKLTPSDITEKCLDAHLQTSYRSEFNNQITIQTLYRAVRQHDNHSAFYFSSPESVGDLADEELDFLTSEYSAINTVTPGEVPT